MRARLGVKFPVIWENTGKFREIGGYRQISH